MDNNTENTAEKTAKETASPTRDDLVSIKDFAKLNLIVAQIKEVKEHPNADRLYVMKVDTGNDVRPLVAGIRAAYSIEELVGRKIVLIENLQPAVIRGEESHGMLLAVGDDKGTTLLKPSREDIALGSKVR